MKRHLSRILSLLILATVLMGTAVAAPKSSDAKFVFGKTTVSIGSKLSTMVKALGDDYDKYETPGCSTGAEYTYKWDGVMAQTTVRKGTAYITSMEITGKTGKTKGGIAVGASRTAVVKKYGEPSSKDGAEYTYKAGSRKLCITFDGDAVASIYIY